MNRDTHNYMNSGRRTTVIFDLDGTLLDTLQDLANSVNYALRTSGFPERQIMEIRLFLGNGIRSLMQNAVPKGTSEEEFERAFATFRAHYLEHCLDTTCPYPGTMELLRKLKSEGYKLAIVSNKLQPAVTELRDRFFGGLIEVAIGESEEVRRKPAPDSVVEALKQLGSTQVESVYIGDSEVDMQTAQNAGLPCISVLWGFRDKDFLLKQGAEIMAATPEDVNDLLN